jgi:hypothetical protein
VKICETCGENKEMLGDFGEFRRSPEQWQETQYIPCEGLKICEICGESKEMLGDFGEFFGGVRRLKIQCSCERESAELEEKARLEKERMVKGLRGEGGGVGVTKL